VLYHFPGLLSGCMYRLLMWRTPNPAVAAVSDKGRIALNLYITLNLPKSAPTSMICHHLLPLSIAVSDGDIGIRPTPGTYTPMLNTRAQLTAPILASAHPVKASTSPQSSHTPSDTILYTSQPSLPHHPSRPVPLSRPLIKNPMNISNVRRYLLEYHSEG